MIIIIQALFMYACSAFFFTKRNEQCRGSSGISGNQHHCYNGQHKRHHQENLVRQINNAAGLKPKLKSINQRKKESSGGTLPRPPLPKDNHGDSDTTTPVNNTESEGIELYHHKKSACNSHQSTGYYKALVTHTRNTYTR